MNPEKHWHDIFELITDMVSLHDKDFRIVKANKPFLAAFNKTEEPVFGISCHQLVHKTDAPICNCPLSHSRESKATAIEEIFEPVLGRYLEVTCYPVVDEKGEFEGVLHFARDITERRRAEDALRRGETNYRLLVENIPQKIFLKDRDSVYISCNDNYARDLNIESSEITGKTDYDFYPRELAGKYRADDKRIMEKGDGEDIEEKYMQNGNEYFVHTVKTPIRDEQGKVFGILGVFSDITERKKSENRISRLNRLYSVLSKVNEAIVRAHDCKELFSRVCRIAVEDGLFKMAWIGLADQESRVIKPAASYGDTDGYLDGVTICSADVPAGKGPTGIAVSEGRCSICTDIEHDPRMFPWRDKALRHGLLSSAAFPIRAGSRVIGAFTVYAHEPQFFTDEEIHLLTSLTEDISFAIDSMANEEKRLAAEEALRLINEHLEQRIAARTADLEAANKELESFIYSISHDLRGPLRVISGFSQVVMKEVADKLDEKGKRYFSRILDETKKMGRLIDDLLNLSRVSRQEIKRSELDLSAIAASIADELCEFYSGRNVSVDIREGITVFADPGLIEIVLTNLLGNSWKFTAKTDHARIEFGTCVQEGRIIYYVRDNGAGFDQRYAEKMFWPFHRLHSEDAFEGTGIGLAIVDRIIRRHGGKVWAEGIEGKGATIYFSLT